MGKAWLILAPIALMLLFLSDQVATQILRRREETSFAVERSTPAEAGFLPALQTLLVQVWMVRIDSDLRAGRPYRALRHGREMLRLAPGTPRARTRLSDILAYRMAPLEVEPVRRLAWIGEGLAVLDEGIERNPTCSEYHTERGLLIWSRGSVSPEFAAAFRRARGATTLKAGVDSLVRGAELARGRWWALRAASVGLKERGDDDLERAELHDEQLLSRALEDYRRAAGYLRELLRFSGFAKPALREDLALAEFREQQALFLLARSRGAPADPAPLLDAARRARVALREGPALSVGSVQLATALAELLAPLETEPERRAALRAEALEILEEGLAREPENPQLFEAASRLR